MFLFGNLSAGELLLDALVLGVVFVNGFTDAPNAVTGAVCSRALTFGRAVALAAVCNLSGLLLAWKFAPRVTNTVCELADFSGVPPRAALFALTGALLAVMAFALAAWVFGIPTSESHALLASLSGSALALGGAARLSAAAWSSVLLGLALSSAGGLAAGWVLGKIGGRGSRRAQIGCTALLALLHGAQDGLKFVGVLLTARALAAGNAPAAGNVDLSGALGLVLLCAAAMSAGTLCGGRRIIAAVGERMVPLDSGSGTASDLAAATLLILATVWGVPMSTTHTKTCAVLGAGAAKGARTDLGTVWEMALAWGITFPVCGALGYLFARLAL